MRMAWFRRPLSRLSCAGALHELLERVGLTHELTEVLAALTVVFDYRTLEIFLGVVLNSNARHILDTELPGAREPAASRDDFETACRDFDHRKWYHHTMPANALQEPRVDIFFSINLNDEMTWREEEGGDKFSGRRLRQRIDGL